MTLLQVLDYPITPFVLRNVSWIPNLKWNALTREQKRKYLPVDPDFVIELMSPLCEAVSFRTDYLSDAQSKMREYIDCGVKLGWLINPDERKVEIYRQERETEVLYNPQTLRGEDVMSGLVVSLEEIFD